MTAARSELVSYSSLGQKEWQKHNRRKKRGHFFISYQPFKMLSKMQNKVPIRKMDNGRTTYSM